MKKNDLKTNTRLSLIFNDVNFQKAAGELRRDYVESLTEKIDSDVIDNIEDGYIRSQLMATYSPHLVARYQQLLETFSLDEEELIKYFIDGVPPPITDVVVGFPDTRSDLPAHYSIYVGPKATKEQVINAYNSTVAHRQSIGVRAFKNRGPDDFLLLYATRMQKNKGSTYEQIAEMIDEERLPGYVREPGAKRFWEPEELKQYYYRYKDYVVKHPV